MLVVHLMDQEYNPTVENAGESIDGDDNNIAIGYDAGKNNTASSNIFILMDAAKALSSSLSSKYFYWTRVVSTRSVSGTCRSTGRNRQWNWY